MTWLFGTNMPSHGVCKHGIRNWKIFYFFNKISLNMKLNRNLRNNEAKIAVYIRVAWVNDIITMLWPEFLMNRKLKLLTYHVITLKIIRQTSLRFEPLTQYSKSTVFRVTQHLMIRMFMDKVNGANLQLKNLCCLKNLP